MPLTWRVFRHCNASPLILAHVQCLLGLLHLQDHMHSLADRHDVRNTVCPARKTGIQYIIHTKHAEGGSFGAAAGHGTRVSGLLAGGVSLGCHSSCSAELIAVQYMCGSARQSCSFSTSDVRLETPADTRTVLIWLRGCSPVFPGRDGLTNNGPRPREYASLQFGQDFPTL